MQRVKSSIVAPAAPVAGLSTSARRRRWAGALLAVLVLVLIVWVVTAPVERRQQWSADAVNALPHIGLYPAEHDERGQPYHWTNGEASVELPVEPGMALLTLGLRQPLAESSPGVHVTLDDSTLALPSSMAARRTHLLLPPVLTGDGTVTLGLRNAAVQPPDGVGPLGLIVERLALTRIAAPVRLFGAQSLTIGLAALALATLFQRMGLPLLALAVAMLLLCAALIALGHGAASVSARWRAVGSTLAGSAVLVAGALLPARTARQRRVDRSAGGWHVYAGDLLGCAEPPTLD